MLYDCCFKITFSIDAFQVQTHVNMADGVSTLKAPSTASVSRVMKARAAKWTLMNASQTPARMTPPASTKLVDSTASACQVWIFYHLLASKAHRYFCLTDCFLCVGYEGVFCQINADDCASQPCLNSGKCIDKINSFHCDCPKGNNINFSALIIRTSHSWVVL